MNDLYTVKVNEIKEGSLVKVDADFTCIKPWTIHTVQEDTMGHYIICDAGRHYLQGQLSENGDTYVGLILAGTYNGFDS